MTFTLTVRFTTAVILLTSLQIRAGMSVGHSPQVANFAPDMRKDASEVTEAEKIDAHRRIRGGLDTQEEEHLQDSSSA